MKSGRNDSGFPASKKRKTRSVVDSQDYQNVQDEHDEQGGFTTQDHHFDQANDNTLSSQGVFAVLALTNTPGHKTAASLAQNRHILSVAHQKIMHVKKLDHLAPTPLDTLGDEDREIDHTGSGTDLERWRATWPLSFEDFRPRNSSPGLWLKIGAGKSWRGDDRGVDVLLVCPGSYAYGVIPHHANFGLHHVTGWPMIQGTSNEHPVIYMTDTGPIELGALQWHGLRSGTNSFYLGEIMCSITWPTLKQSEMEALRLIRDRAFQKCDLEAPDARLPLLPTKKPNWYLNTNIPVFKEIGCGGFGCASLAIDLPCSEARVIKDVHVKSEAGREEAIREAVISLKVSDIPGLIKTFSIIFEGEEFFAGQEDELKAAIEVCELGFHIYFVLEAGQLSFKKLFKSPFSKWPFHVALKLFHQIILALHAFHQTGCLHRDITWNNMLFLRIKPEVKAVLIDFGKSTESLTAKDRHTGPAHTRAPEVDGKKTYGVEADVYSTAFAWACLIDPTIRDMPSYNPYEPQSAAWIEDVRRRFNRLRKISSLHERFFAMLNMMLDQDPIKRLETKTIIALWPSSVTTTRVAEAKKANEERPSKVARTSKV